MQFRIRELMILMAVLPPVAGWLWFAHNVPSLPPPGLFGFRHHISGEGVSAYDAGAIAVAAAIMGLAVVAAIAINRARPT